MNWVVCLGRLNGQRENFLQIIYFEEITILPIVKKVNTTVVPHGRIVHCKRLFFRKRKRKFNSLCSTPMQYISFYQTKQSFPLRSGHITTWWWIHVRNLMNPQSAGLEGLKCTFHM
jgi:hypothetical protein